MTNSRRLTSTALLGSLLFSCYLYFTPYLAILGFKTAIDKKEYRESEKYINFISLRESLKSQLLPVIKDRTQTGFSNSPLGGLKIMLVNSLLEKAVEATLDSTITPYGLQLLLKTGDLTQKNQNNQLTPISSDSARGASKISLYYKNINVFVLSRKLEDDQGVVNSYWERKSLTHWRLRSIDLPLRTIRSIKP
ncbi:DUF2939 domain-containing protein [Prochlorococcus sp. MIT 0603]|uniref:DUF2939 domain-containing protein n=1 Tax=Prochlorococcus sp. MIT 0603 TaxID=1499500 RepID=UPI00187C8E3A|nr:DUF2939 domain-containing protein [Prochlorococcus sp. MIT 0603]